MITVLAYFYHPALGTVRGTVIDGVPMLSCRELSIFLARFSSDELDDILRQNYHTEDVVVPVSVDVHGYAAWLGDFVFPMLMQMNGTTEVKRDAQYFYWECTDPKPEKTEMLNNHLFDLFD